MTEAPKVLTLTENQTYRFVVETEIEPTWPDDWGWSADAHEEYMEQVENGEYVVVMASLYVVTTCPHCGTETPELVGHLGDIHVDANDMHGYLDTVRADLIDEHAHAQRTP